MLNQDALLHLISEFINLVNACEDWDVVLPEITGTSFLGCRETIDNALGELGYSQDDIVDVWTGEAQLTSS